MRTKEDFKLEKIFGSDREDEFAVLRDWEKDAKAKAKAELKKNKKKSKKAK